jgi:glycosyltransferase 2 family protein
LRHRISIGVGLAVSILFLWLALRNANFVEIQASLAAANWLWAAPFLLALFSFYWLKSARWGYLLSLPGKHHAPQLFPIVMIGYAGTSVLPMQMGEFVRAWIASKQYQLRYSQVLSSIGVERIFDLLTILALLASIFAAGQTLPAMLIKAGYVIAAVTLAGLVVAFGLAAFTDKALAMCRWLLSPLPERIQHTVLDQLEAASQGLSALTQPRLIVKVAANSIAQWALMGACIGCSLLAVGIDVTIGAVALVLVATIVGISLPTSPGYIGNIQLAFVVALQPFGVSVDNAIAASVFYHVIAYVSVVVVGFSFLHRLGLGLFEIKSEAESRSPESDSS